MSAGTKIVFEFGDASGNSLFYTYNFGDDEASISDIKNAMNSFISNGSIFQNVPVSIKSAKVVITSESDFDLT